MGLIGTYTLQLYCDHAAASAEACTAWPGIFLGLTIGSAKAAARRGGWKLRPALSPSADTLGSPFNGACFCVDHAWDIPDIPKIAEEIA